MAFIPLSFICTSRYLSHSFQMNVTMNLGLWWSLKTCCVMFISWKTMFLSLPVKWRGGRCCLFQLVLIRLQRLLMTQTIMLKLGMYLIYFLPFIKNLKKYCIWKNHWLVNWQALWTCSKIVDRMWTFTKSSKTVFCYRLSFNYF